MGHVPASQAGGAKLATCATAFIWSSILLLHHVQEDNLILGGDLNFSIRYSESWGHNAQIDFLSDFFKNILEDHGLIDIPSARLQPT